MKIPHVTQIAEVPAALEQVGFVILRIRIPELTEAYAQARQLTDPIVEEFLPDGKGYWHFGRGEEPFAGLFAFLENTATQILSACGYDDVACDGNHRLRVCRYEGDGGCGEHSDLSLLTLLPAATAAGLQVQARDGSWIPVDARPGELIVNSGEQLSLLSEGRFPATPHRVMWCEQQGIRYSMPFFAVAGRDAQLAPGIDAGSFLKRRLAEIRS